MGENAGPTGSRNDPFGSFNFMVEINGIATGFFSSCAGLSGQTEVMEFQEGGENSTVHKLVGQTRYSNLVLKRGITANAELWDWYQQIAMAEGPIQKREGSVVLFNDAHEEVARWNFYDGWPCKWEGPEFDSRASAGVIGVETLEIAHSRIQRMR